MKTFSHYKTAFLFLLPILFSGKVLSQSHQWTWINGDNTINQYGIYDMQGIPSDVNKPGARSESASWKDKSGNLWLFGGVGYGYYNAWGSLNDLWKYNSCTNEWTWLKGSQSPWAIGVYGTKGIPASNNNPGARQMSASWIDATGNLWLFGGSGANYYNDLWKYDIISNQWTWVNGDNTGNKRGVYGVQGVSSAASKPGARSNPACWTDNSGNLWMYGGNGYAASGGGGYLGDLWKYNIGTNIWTWMKGDSLLSIQPDYGNRNVSSPSNKPGSRTGSSSWKDQSGNLWLFGGFGYVNTLGNLNDLWKYDPATNEWMWVHGDNVTGHFAVYGNPGTAAPSTRPGGMLNAATWTDPSGGLWLFGGRGNTNNAFGELNSLWKYNITANQWMFIKGDFSTFVGGEYGSLGIPDETNKPGSREESVSWTDSLGNLWMFGGESYPMNSNVTYFHNDVWKFSYINFLPVKLVSFNGKLQDKNILLNWDVESETGFDRYEIQKSYNGTAFETIGNVKALNRNNYNFTDVEKGQHSIVYYRLKMIDIDGKFSYSNIINFKMQESTGFTLYPNPANTFTQVSFNKNINDKVIVEIINAEGKLLMKRACDVIENKIMISTNNLAAGNYAIAIIYNGKRDVRHLVVIK